MKATAQKEQIITRHIVGTNGKPKTIKEVVTTYNNLQASDALAKERVASKLFPSKPTQSTADDFLPPLEIRKGGTYTGKYRSTDSSVPAISVFTNEPVEITKCEIEHAGDGIKGYGGADPNIHNNKMTGLPPTGGAQWGRCIDMWDPQGFIFVNNEVNRSGGILLNAYGGTRSGQKVRIGYNKIYNTDKRKLDNSGAGHRAAIQLNTMRHLDCYIAWNEIINEAGNSYVEDNINIYNSSGTKENPLLIHNNYIFGAYPFPLNATNFTGSGITVDGSPDDGNTFEKVSCYINAYDNQVISTCNAAMNIATGHDVHYYNNRIISSGMFPDGTKSPLYWAGCCMWNGSKLSEKVFFGNTIEGNDIGFVHWGEPHYPDNMKDRHDEMSDRKVNLMPIGKNRYFKYNPILNDEKAEFEIWQGKLKANNITLGIEEKPTTTIPEGIVHVGKTLQAEFAALDKDGKTLIFKAAEAFTDSKDLFDVSIVLRNRFYVVPKTEGTGTGRLIVDGFTKPFKITVVKSESNPGNPVFDVRIEFTEID